MAYIGQAPFQEYSSVPTKDNFTGDGSTTTFDLANIVPAGAENALEVFVANVRQEPGSGKAFTLGQDGSGDMKRITFSSAPTNGAAIYVINDKTSTTTIAPTSNDLNGSELILDADADTSITADTDDRIDFKIANTDHISIGTSSGDTLIKQMTDAKDILFQQYDGRTILDINDAGYVALANGATGSGELRIYEDTDNGTNYTGFKVGAQSANIDYVLPTADGSSGQALVTNGSGVLSFATAGAITSYTNSTNNRIVTSVDSSTVNSEANLTFDGSALQVTGTLTVGANDTGHDVIFYGASASANMTWDESADDLILNGAAGLIVPDGQLTLGSTAVTSTAAELNIVDGGTSATSTTVADADRVVMNDNGTMVQVAVTDLAAYFDDEITAMPNLTSVGTLTALTVDDVAVNGKVITMTGSSSDTATLTAGTNGTLDIVTTDAGGAAANIQITADGTAELAGTTVTLDSSGGITLDADGGTITFADGGSSLGTITSSGYSGTAAVATTVTITDNESTDEANAIIFAAGGDVDGGNLGLESDGDLTYNPSSGTLNVPNISVTGTQTIVNSVTMNASNAVIFEGATADAYETTLTSVDATSSDKTISLPNVSGTLPVLAAASTTQITATPEEINLIDGGTARGTTAVATGDGILINDGGTMRMTNVDTVRTYMEADSLPLAGGTMTGHILGGDNIYLKLGAGEDLQLYHDGSNSYIGDQGTGNLILGGTAIELKGGGDYGETLATFTDNGSVDLYYDNSKKFETTSAGATVTGVLTADGGIDIDNFNIDGTTIALSSGNLTLDAASDIVLDADNGSFIFQDGGTEIWRQFNSSSDVYIRAAISDKDIYFQGNDGGSNITALTLDMSDAGTASFNHDIKLVDNGQILVGTGEDLVIKHDGSNSFINNGTGNLTIDAQAGDADIIFKGTDGGSDITALTLDMSAAGAATFNNDVTAFSDARLKENVETIDNALDKVCAMRGVTFNRIDNENGKRQMGVIAQEIQDIVPEVVKVNDDEDSTLSVSYGNLVGVLIESIKELKAEIDELKGN